MANEGIDKENVRFCLWSINWMENLFILVRKDRNRWKEDVRENV